MCSIQLMGLTQYRTFNASVTNTFKRLLKKSQNLILEPEALLYLCVRLCGGGNQYSK